MERNLLQLLVVAHEFPWSSYDFPMVFAIADGKTHAFPISHGFSRGGAYAKELAYWCCLFSVNQWRMEDELGNGQNRRTGGNGSELWLPKCMLQSPWAARELLRSTQSFPIT